MKRTEEAGVDKQQGMQEGERPLGGGAVVNAFCRAHENRNDTETMLASRRCRGGA